MKRYIRTSEATSFSDIIKLRKFIDSDYLVSISSTTGHLYDLGWTPAQMRKGKNVHGSSGFNCGKFPFFANIVTIDDTKVVFDYVDSAIFYYQRYSESLIDLLFTEGWSRMWRFQLPLEFVDVTSPLEIISKQELIDELRLRIQ